jgi:hypothetical protein
MLLYGASYETRTIKELLFSKIWTNVNREKGFANHVFSVSSVVTFFVYYEPLQHYILCVINTKPYSAGAILT